MVLERLSCRGPLFFIVGAQADEQIEGVGGGPGTENGDPDPGVRGEVEVHAHKPLAAHKQQHIFMYVTVPVLKIFHCLTH